MDPNIVKAIMIIVWGVIVGFAVGLALRNYNEIKLHRKVLDKLIGEFRRLEVKEEAKELADKITDMIFGEDKPEDLEKAIKDAAEEGGLAVDSIIVKGRKKSATKKADKKEKK